MQELLWDKYKEKKAFRTYCRFYAGYGWKLFFSVVMFLIKSSPMYVIPVITANIINLLSETGPGFQQELLKQLFFGLALLIQNIPTHTLYIRLFSQVSRQVEMNLRTALCARLQHLSMHYHTSNKMGVLQTKVLRDVENVENMTRMLVDGLPGLFATLGVAVFITLTRAPVFALFYLALVPVACLIYRLTRRAMAERNRAFRLSVEDMTGRVNEMLRMIPVTRAHHLEDQELGKLKTKLEQIRSTGLRIDSFNAIFGSVSWSVMMSFNILTLCSAALLRYHGILNVGIGDIVLLSTYFGQIAGCVMQLLGFMPALTKGLESVQSIGEILECPDIEQNEDKQEMTSLCGEFSFEHVSFRYPGTETDALSDFTLHVKKGENIALVGASGAGKSTIAQLVIGFIRPTSGRIVLDGKDMNDLDLRTYRRFISVVTQETILFDGTIRDNIAYGISGASDDEILRVIKYANLEELVRGLPDGLNTRLQENGSRLSGGQRQRIAIARALLRDPKVLVLDEATSALDVDSESEIKASLEHLVRGRTTFTVAHRLSTIRNADRIVVMGDGRILEIGTHAELLAKKGRYAEMFEKFSKAN